MWKIASPCILHIGRFIVFDFLYFRIQLQDMVRRSSSVSPEEQEVIEEKRVSLVAMFSQLKDLQTKAGIIEDTANEKPVLDDEIEYDEYNDSEEVPISQALSEIIPIERKVIVLPSNGNVVTNVSNLEVTFRKRQAQSQLDQLRDLIADISFQFSHVIRGQIRKNIRTRSQKRVKSLHNQLAFHARIYTRCRNHLIALNCDPSILAQYRVLKKDDLKSSTAILDPNQPGSTALKLSWIWHSGRWLIMNGDTLGAAVPVSGAVPDPASVPESEPASEPTNLGPASVEDPLTLHECMFFFFVLLLSVLIYF